METLTSQSTKTRELKIAPVKPRELQKLLLNCTHRNQVIVAHRRFGKTTYALLKILDSCAPNTRFFYVAPTYRQAKVIAWQMLLDLIPPQLIVKKNEMDLLVRLANGATIELKGADNPDSLRGVGLNGVVFDEYPLMDNSIWTEIIRPALTDKQGWAIFMGTPKGKNHFYDAFVNAPVDAKFNFKASETGIISEAELALARKEMSQEEYDQEFENAFLYFSGQVYKEFREDIHVIKPFPIDQTWLRYATIDHGQVNPTAVLWTAVDYDGKVFVYDEYYEAGRTVQQNAQIIKLKSDNLRTVPFLDPSAFAKNRSQGERMYSVADEYEDNGLPCVPAQNDVLGGINRVKEHLQSGKLFIFSTCKNLLNEINTYRWKDRKPNQNAPDAPVKLNDHAVDCLRMFILSRPYAPKWPTYRKAIHDQYKQLTSLKKDARGGWYD